MAKYLVSPAPRWALLVVGKALGNGVRSVSQAAVIFVLAARMGVHLRFGPTAILGLLVFALLGPAVFATFSLVITSLVKTRERFMDIGQLVTRPHFFASNAIYPVALMPHWLAVIAHLVDALRALMIVGWRSVLGLGTDFAVLSLVLVALASHPYPAILG